MRLTAGVVALLWALAIGFFLQQFVDPGIVRLFMLWPLGEYTGIGEGGELTSVGFMPWQIVTYGFLHGDFGHLFFNCLALYMFGALATSGLLGPGLYPTIGASGGVYGLLLGYAMLFPHQRVMLLIPPIPMKARTLAILFGAIALVSGVLSTGSGVAHFAHLGGMIFGWLMIRYWRGQPPFKPRGPRRPDLRSVN
jgi:membrane associated rhomboid family serine protease